MGMKMDFEELVVIHGNNMVSIEWIGEGVDGDYNENDAGDLPMLRFYCSKYNDEVGDFEELPSGSYCTNLTTATPRSALLIYADMLLTAIEEGEDYRHKLEELTWIKKESLTYPA